MPDLFSSILINLSGLTDLTNISLTAAIVVSLLLGREKKTHTWLMICGVTSLLCVLVCFFILDVSANSDWVPVQFLFIILTLGFLILFPYHFPFFDPANRWPARIALAAAVTAFLLGILATVSWYLSLIAPMTIRFIFNGIFILEYFYLIANLLMQTVRLSRSNTGNDPLRTSQQGILSALMRPVGRYAKATRAFTLVILSPLLVAFLTLAYYAELIPYGVFLLIFDYGFLVCLFAFMMIYLNYSVEQTTFLVKLVLSTLVIVLVVVNIMYSITLSGHIESYMAARSADVRMVEKALMKTGPAGEINPDDVPSSVQFVVSRSLTNTGRGMQYTPHIVRDAGFSLAYANRKGLETLPTVLFIRAGDSDSSMYSIFKFDARERKYIVGFALSGYREVLHPYTLPIMLLILGSTLAVMLILPLFFRISLIRPLDNLLEGVRLLDEGQMNINLNVQYNDEIGYLTSAFNRMVSSLSKAEELKAIQQELEMARQIQTGLLPKEPPVMPGLDIAGRSIPSRMVGGDLYFYHQFQAIEGRDPNSCAIAVGDVTGKGMPAALYMAVSMAVLSARAPVMEDVGRLMGELNGTLHHFMSRNRMFTALCYVRVDRNPGGALTYRVQISNAGLISPLLRRGNECRYLELGGLPLGILRTPPAYQTMEFPLEEGDMLILSSDGIVEARNSAGELYGFDRFRDRAATAPFTARDAIDWIISDARSFSDDADQLDDMTVLVVHAAPGGREVRG